MLVREVMGLADGYPSQTVTYRATKFNVSDPTPAEKKKTNWVVKIDGGDVVQGESLTFEIKEVHDGGQIPSSLSSITSTIRHTIFKYAVDQMY